tara:strand:- start:36 stop:146 length:111 start_codon:yes stop_codon:yes gene_type:complete
MEKVRLSGEHQSRTTCYSLQQAMEVETTKGKWLKNR